MNTPHDNNKDFSALARVFGYFQRPNVARAALIGFMILSGALLAVDFFYSKKSYIDVEKLAAFYPLSGFFAGALFIVIALALRKITARDADYFAPYDTQAESHPKDDLGPDTSND